MFIGWAGHLQLKPSPFYGARYQEVQDQQGGTPGTLIQCK